jgi:CDP-diacylglycerol---glycerol-3-phosphate 3-phosphatidyltransferase
MEINNEVREDEKSLEEASKRKGMTLPNKLTIMRILFIPAIVIIFYIPYLRENYIFKSVSYANFIDAILFVLASLTDMLDGKIARKYNLVTTFGKFADPLADKCLVFTALFLLLAQGSNIGVFSTVVPLWAVVCIMIREFMVSGIRLVAAGNGDVIAASKLGKWKTASTMVALTILFFFGLASWVEWVGFALFMVATLLTIISGIDYFWKNRKIILKSI